jgi:hypothetical protein
MTNPAEWASDQRADSDPCLENFVLFAEEINWIYRVENHCIRAVMKMMDDDIQLPNEPARAYANRIKANWRLIGGVKSHLLLPTTPVFLTSPAPTPAGPASHAGLGAMRCM